MGGAKRFITIILIFVGLILLSSATFTIDEKEQAIITQFGKYIRTIQEPGLYFKIPIIQTLHLFEKRVLTTDALAAVEYITLDKKRVVVDHVSRWKIEAHLQAKRFVIKIIDVRIKRADLPKEVQASVYARMQAERHRIAKRYRAEGEQRSREIKAETDKEKEIILAKAYQQQMKLFGEGDGRATEIYASSYEQDMEFYSFLRRLQTYEKLFEGKTTILLESDSELLKYFRSPRISSK